MNLNDWGLETLMWPFRLSKTLNFRNLHFQNFKLIAISSQQTYLLIIIKALKHPFIKIEFLHFVLFDRRR